VVKKVSIIGAGGVGSNVAFSLLHRAPPKELVLVDVNRGLAEGISLDLEDSRGFLDFSTNIKGTSNYSAIGNSDIIVITAGIARKKGMTRLDLLKTNTLVAKTISKEIKRYAPKSIVIVVTNPLDLITYVVRRATGFDRNRVIGMGSSLDTSRLFTIIHGFSNIAASSLEGFIFGQHSKDMIVSLNRILVKGESLSKFISKNKLLTIKNKVQLRGAEIVSCLKTKSAAFGPGASCAYLIEAIATDSNKVIPVSVLLDGEYGLKGICIGVPCVIGAKGVSKIIEISLNKSEKEELKKAKELFKDV
jgi:malate dehydrogenase